MDAEIEWKFSGPSCMGPSFKFKRAGPKFKDEVNIAIEYGINLSAD